VNRKLVAVVALIVAAVLAVPLLLVTVGSAATSTLPTPACTVAVPSATAAPPSVAAAPADLASYLQAVRTHESGGNYTAASPFSTASGAYQFIDGTWRSESAAAGQPFYARAMNAPPAVQDAVAGFMATNLFNSPAGAGQWGNVAGAWYIGHVPRGAEWDTVPGGGNGSLTPRMYAAQIAALMAGGPPTAGLVADPAPDPGAECVAPDGTLVLAAATAISPAGLDAMWAFVAAQVGKPYLWGGNGPGAYDCSGLTQQGFKAAGVVLPRTAADQYTATAASAVPYTQAQPGMLLFWSYDGKGGDAHHVAIYLGGDMMVDAPHTGAFVRVEKVWHTPDFIPVATVA
jgi:cell wall-associated NlpC family hydrolase